MRNGTQRIGRVLALATAIVAVAAPAAWASTVEERLPASGSGEAEEQGYSSVNSISPYTPETSPAPAPTSVSGDGFDWGDAGIGATALLALVAVAGGGALVLRHRPHRGSVA
jgi:hypothetical protein